MMFHESKNNWICLTYIMYYVGKNLREEINKSYKTILNYIKDLHGQTQAF